MDQKRHSGSLIERLHGHNYAVSLRVSGEIAENGFVVDFASLKAALRRVTTALNHRVLVPGRSSRLVLSETSSCLEITVDGKRYVFPLDDVALLPIINTTVEVLASYSVRCCAMRESPSGASTIVAGPAGTPFVRASPMPSNSVSAPHASSRPHPRRIWRKTHECGTRREPWPTAQALLARHWARTPHEQITPELGGLRR